MNNASTAVANDNFFPAASHPLSDFLKTNTLGVTIFNTGLTPSGGSIANYYVLKLANPGTYDFYMHATGTGISGLVPIVEIDANSITTSTNVYSVYLASGLQGISHYKIVIANDSPTTKSAVVSFHSSSTTMTSGSIVVYYVTNYSTNPTIKSKKIRSIESADEAISDLRKQIQEMFEERRESRRLSKEEKKEEKFDLCLNTEEGSEEYQHFPSMLDHEIKLSERYYADEQCRLNAKRFVKEGPNDLVKQYRIDMKENMWLWCPFHSWERPYMQHNLVALVLNNFNDPTSPQKSVVKSDFFKKPETQ